MRKKGERSERGRLHERSWPQGRTRVVAQWGCSHEPNRDGPGRRWLRTPPGHRTFPPVKTGRWHHQVHKSSVRYLQYPSRLPNLGGGGAGRPYWGYLEGTASAPSILANRVAGISLLIRKKGQVAVYVALALSWTCKLHLHLTFWCGWNRPERSGHPIFFFCWCTTVSVSGDGSHAAISSPSQSQSPWPWPRTRHPAAETGRDAQHNLNHNHNHMEPPVIRPVRRTGHFSAGGVLLVSKARRIVPATDSLSTTCQC